MKQTFRTYWPYLVLTAAVLLPLFAPGYILTLDAVFTPRLPAPDALTSDFLWRWALHLLNIAVPSQVIEKLLFTGILLASAVGAHRLSVALFKRVPEDSGLAWKLASYAAGGLYMVNPFTYDRFMAGQYGVLLGYALLPFAVQAWLAFTRRPGWRELAQVTALAVAISIVSLPTIGELAVVAACILAVSLWRARRRPVHLRALALRTCVVVLLFIALSSYWLVPALLGKGATAQQIAGFGAAHTAAFATLGNNAFEKTLAVLRLQGFWVENQGLYVLPQDRLPGWGTIRLAVWALVITGAVVLWRRSRAQAAILTAAGVAATAIAAGAFSALLTQVGYREPQKFAGLLALVFALLFAVGAARLFGWARKHAEQHYTTAASAVLLVVLLFTPPMFWGFGGQLQPRQYPAGWSAARDYLNRQQGSFAVVFLPWHQYMSFGFADRVIANPAPLFFGSNVVVSNNPELGEITPPAGQATRIGELVAPEGPARDLAVRLAHENVRYVLLAKDYDYRRYRYLDVQDGLKQVQDSKALRVYENTAWKGGK